MTHLPILKWVKIHLEMGKNVILFYLAKIFQNRIFDNVQWKGWPIQYMSAIIFTISAEKIHS